MDDNRVWPLLSEMVECLTSEFDASMANPTDDAPHEAPSIITVLPGSGVPMDYVGGGSNCSLAWVRMSSAFPSFRLPEADTSPDSCKAPMAFTLEVGAVRCAPMPKMVMKTVTLPTPEEQYETARVQMADMRVLRRAIRCCLGTDRDYVLGNYTPVTDLGGVVGGAFEVVVSEDI